MKRRQAFRLALGKVLRDHRRKAELSQERLAFRAGLHPTYISQLERGTKSPTVDALSGIAKALGHPMSEIIRLAEDAG